MLLLCSPPRQSALMHDFRMATCKMAKAGRRRSTCDKPALSARYFIPAGKTVKVAQTHRGCTQEQSFPPGCAPQILRRSLQCAARCSNPCRVLPRTCPICNPETLRASLARRIRLSEPHSNLTGLPGCGTGRQQARALQGEGRSPQPPHPFHTLLGLRCCRTCRCMVKSTWRESKTGAQALCMRWSIFYHPTCRLLPVRPMSGTTPRRLSRRVQVPPRFCPAENETTAITAGSTAQACSIAEPSARVGGFRSPECLLPRQHKSVAESGLLFQVLELSSMASASKHNCAHQT